MKSISILSLIFVASIFIPSTVWANDFNVKEWTQELKKKNDRMDQEYRAEVDELQAEVDRMCEEFRSDKKRLDRCIHEVVVSNRRGK